MADWYAVFVLRLTLGIAIGLFASALHGYADAHIVQKFSGTDTTTTTAPFTVHDKWELVWIAPRAMSVTVLSPDGTVITGTHTNFKGSLYLPKGGTYYLQLSATPPAMQNGTPPPNFQSPNMAAMPWLIVVAEVADGTNLSQDDVNSLATGSGPGGAGFMLWTGVYTSPGAAPPSSGQTAGNPSTPASSPTPPVTAAVTPPAPGTTPTVKLTDDQARAVVLITGDNGEGTGFMVKTPDGPAIITNIHVIADNPNLKITTNTGARVTVLSMKGASDRDLAMLAIKDANYNYLEVSTDISQTVQPGDEVITPGNSQGGEVMLNTGGKILGLGPERIEFDNPIYHGNSGGPVFHPKSGKVLGVVTEAIKVNTTDDLDKASFASRNSAISGSMRYFGLRLDTISAWVPIDSDRFQNETAFLDQFHKDSRALDSYLNSKSGDGGDKDANLYRSNEKIMKANDNYFHDTSGADVSQRIQSAKDLLFDLQGVADYNMDQIQNANNFYSFNRERAEDEIAYRKALKRELDEIGNNVDRLTGLPHSSN